VAGLWEIAVGAVLHGVGITVAELSFWSCGRFVCARQAPETFPRSASFRRWSLVLQHGKPFEARVSIRNEYRVRLRRKLGGGNAVCKCVCTRKLLK